jgi:hypothetical protein
MRIKGIDQHNETRTRVPEIDNAARDLSRIENRKQKNSNNQAATAAPQR